jgi:putative ABC transport system permease protein
VLGLGSASESVGKVVQINVSQPFSVEAVQQILGQNQGTIRADQFANPDSLRPAEKTVSLRIAGVNKKPATSIAVGQLPIVLSAEDARDLYDFTTKGTPDYEKYVFVYARVKDGQDPEKLADAKSQIEKKGYYVQSIKDVQKTITQFVNILQTMVGVFAIITLIASIFGIINTQYISVLERTKEIGLMKALGMRSRDVRRLFILEASWIGFLGGLIGATAALILGTLLNPWITKKLDLGNDSLIIFKPDQIMILLLSLVVVGALAGYFPTHKTAKMNPIDALRSE